jgi:pheromone shutdown-related protein TraB
MSASDVRVVEIDGRRIVLVGTAHVSRESTDLVRRVIEDESPDVVCVELDAQRHRALTHGPDWESLDLRQLIRTGQLPTFVLHLLLGSYQKRLGLGLGVTPGAELLEAARVAGERGVPVELADRSVRVTLLRAWRSLGFWRRNKLVAAILASAFTDAKLSEDDLRELRRQDVLSELIAELAREMPELKGALIDERDAYLAEKIRRAPGRVVVAVVGAGHRDGVARRLEEREPVDLAPLETVPPGSRLWRHLGWLVPATIVGAFAALAWVRGPDVAGENLKVWALATGIPCGLGAIAALAHPLTIATAFVVAPITTLHPLLGAGHVTAIVQAWVRPPRVRDFQTVSDDLSRPRAWWSNRLLRVFLAFLLPSLGAMAGLYIGGAAVIRELF